jgi:hypothetical protein
MSDTCNNHPKLELELFIYLSLFLHSFQKVVIMYLLGGVCMNTYLLRGTLVYTSTEVY